MLGTNVKCQMQKFQIGTNVNKLVLVLKMHTVNKILLKLISNCTDKDNDISKSAKIYLDFVLFMSFAFFVALN